MNVPFLQFNPVNQQIRAEVLENFAAFFDKAYYVLGDQLRAFEAQYASLNEVEHCVGVANGLEGLMIALQVGGIRPGDEVIVPSNTYIASTLAVSHIGAKPVPVEPDSRTYNIDPARIEAAITPRTRGIMPVHLYGQICEMDRIMQIARKHDLWVVEDNAQGHLSRCLGKMAGSFGQANATSFYPTKNLGALGDAGAITTDDEAIAKQVQILRNYGSERKYYNQVRGHNSRLDELQAGILSIKLRYLETWTAERQQLAHRYLDQLADLEELTLPHTAEGCTHVYHIFLVRSPRRDQLQQHLREKGVGTLIHYPIPPHLQPAYADAGWKPGEFPLAEEIAETCLSLPLYPGLEEAQVDYVCEQIRAFFAA